MITGRCLCGAIRYRVDPNHVLWRGHCHCDSCRRACSAPLTTFFGVANQGWEWTAAMPTRFRSSEDVERFFCPTCGSQMAYRSTRFPDETHFYAASLDDPSDFQPDAHFFWSEHVPWLEPSDDLPRKR